MKQGIVAAVVLLGLTAVPATASNLALIIQAYRPEEGWEAEDEDPQNELWNDIYLMLEGLDTAKWGRLMPLSTFPPERIHVLHGTGQDWPSRAWRYDPRVQYADTSMWMTDAPAHFDTIVRYLVAFAHGDQGLGIEALGQNDTLFIYTWGHGGCASAGRA